MFHETQWCQRASSEEDVINQTASNYKVVISCFWQANSRSILSSCCCLWLVFFCMLFNIYIFFWMVEKVWWDLCESVLVCWIKIQCAAALLLRAGPGQSSEWCFKVLNLLIDVERKCINNKKYILRIIADIRKKNVFRQIEGTSCFIPWAVELLHLEMLGYKWAMLIAFSCRMTVKVDSCTGGHLKC